MNRNAILVGAGIATVAGLALYLTMKPSGKYKCPYCGETFDTADELLDHMMHKHKDKMVHITWD